MKRYEDWAARLDAYLRAQENREFDWGAFNCAFFAMDAVLVMTGVDHASEYRGTFKTAAGAARALRKNGFENLKLLAVSKFGAPLPSCRYAQRGDLIGFETPEGFILGIVDLSGIKFAAVTLNHGLVRINMAQARCAWRI